MAKKKGKKQNKNNVSRVEKNKNSYKKDKNFLEVEKINEDLDQMDITNVSQLTFDDIRLADLETLDTSFLESRTNKEKATRNLIKAETKNKRKKKDKTSKRDFSDYDEFYKEYKKSNFRFDLVIRLFIIFVVVFLLGFAFLYFVNFDHETPKKKDKTSAVTSIVIDDNYLFLGDSITELYHLDDYYSGMPVVNSGESGNTTQDILDHMRERVYQYNPSKIFLLIGTNDLAEGISQETILDNIEKMIDEIQNNRPYATIYLESIYPVNNTDEEKIEHDVVKDRSNKDIREINQKLKDIAKKKKITYIDMYDILKDENGNLNLDYTKEGLHISDDGYKVITKEIKKYLK